MPQRFTYLGKIRNDSPLSKVIASLNEQQRSAPLKVRFEGKWKGMLHLDYPRAAVWAKMMDYLQENNRPVYVEMDIETSVITKFCIPKAETVLRIQPGEETDYIYFSSSQPRHYLRHNLPQYADFIKTLQNSLSINKPKLVTATHDDFEIIDVREIPPSFGIDGPPDPPPPPVPDPSVTPSRATDLFNMMKAETCSPCSSTSPCISFKYPYDGCWIRAHMMCYLMIAQGETPEKIWIQGGLTALSENVPECHVNWGWHVAPTLMVTQTAGPDIKMVIDPSLCDSPVTPEFWKSLQGDGSASLTPTSWDIYNYISSTTATASQSRADNDMQMYRLLLDELCSDYGSSPYECPILKKCFFIVDRSTVSKDEVDTMINAGIPAIVDSAFYVVVDGFTPADFGITAASLSGIPAIHPVLNFAPAFPQMFIELMPGIGLEDPFHLIRRQRITWTYRIRFTGSGGFINELEDITINASITSIINPVATVMSSAQIDLITQPNPYETDGQTYWLSTDLRVFQIKTGDSQFNKQMLSDPNDFITSVINNLNMGTSGSQTFDTISTDEQTSKLELSHDINGVNIYNFAVAKVRYRGGFLAATNVRVFFRLFPASSTSLEYNQATTYRRILKAGAVKPLLGIIDGETVTIPCFANARVDSSLTAMTDQFDPANVQTFAPIAGGNESAYYFGCWLDINQTQPQFPINPSPMDGPYPAASRITIQQLVRNEHQCLAAEIAFDPTPIQTGTSPALSDKLAQRNLAIIESANPGDWASHRIPHTFEIKPTRPVRGITQEVPDELMINWGHTPAGSIATLHFSGIFVDDILQLEIKNYRSNHLIRIDANTLQLETGGISYIPLPGGRDLPVPVLLMIDLPSGVKDGQVFKLVVRQVINDKANSERLSAGIRRILGSFQITIPVTKKQNMLFREEILLSNLRWIQKSIPLTNRWYPVFSKYTNQIAKRVDALGGISVHVLASPGGDWKQKYSSCRNFSLSVIISIAALLIVSGILNGRIILLADLIIIEFLLFLFNFWIKKCEPSKCRKTLSVLLGMAIGSASLIILFFMGLSAPQLLSVLISGVILSAVLLIYGKIKKCF
jgi:Glutaminase